MRKYTLLLGAVLFLTTLLSSCYRPQPQEYPETWEEHLNNKMFYLGHRNWIVVADMAYPLQSGPGITTLFAREPYPAVLSRVKKMIDEAPHVFAHVYNDKELSYISEEDMPGIDTLRAEMTRICGNEVISLPHEELISKLDEAGRLYNVIIIKTPLSKAYTTTFFELDCAYWNGEKQEKLDKAMAEKTE